MANEHVLLDKHGWETRLWGVTNDMIAGTWGRITVTVRTAYSRPARDEVARVIDEFAPAVVHVHNFFPLLSPSVYDACRAAGIAVGANAVQLSHICPGGLLVRDRCPCFDCIGASP